MRPLTAMAGLDKLPVLLAARDWEAAERLLRRAARARGAAPEVFYNLARVLEEAGRGAQSAHWLEKAV
ncbi:MAG: hypothetical protein AAFV86_17125, partial [Pseudomonadota bacterium]